MSDVLPANSQESLSSGPNVPANNKSSAIERLRKRMEGYRDIQSSRLPEYEQTMNHVNTQQMQETLVLRQKYLESKAKKPNKRSSNSNNTISSNSSSSTSAGCPGGPAPGPPMNGIMQYHGAP